MVLLENSAIIERYKNKNKNKSSPQAFARISLKQAPSEKLSHQRSLLEPPPLPPT